MHTTTLGQHPRQVVGWALVWVADITYIWTWWGRLIGTKTLAWLSPAPWPVWKQGLPGQMATGTRTVIGEVFGCWMIALSFTALIIDGPREARRSSPP